MTYLGRKRFGIVWWWRGIPRYWFFRVHKYNFESITKGGVTSNHYIFFWETGEPDVTEDVDEFTTTSTTETDVCSITALAPDNMYSAIFIPDAISFRVRIGIKGDGTNTVYLTKVAFEWGVTDSTELIPLVTKQISVNISTTSTSYVWYWIDTPPEPVAVTRNKILPIHTDYMYLKLTLSGYVSGGTGYFGIYMTNNGSYLGLRLKGYMIYNLANLNDYTVIKKFDVV